MPARVVHVDTEHGFSGGEVQVFVLLEGLRERGVAVALVTPGGSAAERVARERGIEVHTLGMRNSFDLWSAVRLARLLRGASLVHLHTGRAAWLGSIAARLAGCPVVITRRMDRRVKRDLRTRFAYGRMAGAVVAISPAVERCLVAGGVPPARIRVVWEALDVRRITATQGRAAARAALGLGDGEFAVLTMAALMHRKGIDVLLRAVAQLQDPRLRLLLAGDGPEHAALQQLASELGIAAQVAFLGRRDDPGDLLAACDLFALPSRAEGLGVAALEALGAARPVVASRVGGLGEMVVDGQCGLLVPPEDPTALANAIARVRDDAALRARLAAGGPRRLDEGFRPHQVVDRHLEIYAAVLRAAGARG